MDEDFVAALESRLSAIEGDLVRYRQGKVSAISPNLQVTLGGSSTAISNVSQISSAALSVNDVVAALAFGNDLLVLGEIGAGTGAIPPGAITAFGGSTAPSGWLKCDGSSVSQTTYAGLFAVIGTTYGGGGGNFTLPNLAGKFPLGVSGSHALASTGGAETHTLAVSEMPQHNHGGSTGTGTSGTSNSDLNHTHSVNGSGNGVVRSGFGGTAANLATTGGSFVYDNFQTAAVNLTSHTHSVPALTISNQGGGGAHNNMPPYLSLNFIIKT